MAADESGSASSLQRSRLRLIGRLRLHLPEALQAVLSGMDSRVPDSDGERRARHDSARRELAGTCLEWGLRAIEGGERQAGPVPPIVLEHVRRAVQDGVALDALLDRCRSSYEVAWTLLLEELAAAEIDEPDRAIVLGEVSAAASALFARLLIGVVGVYGGEGERSARAPSQCYGEVLRELRASDGLTELAPAGSHDESGRA